LLISPLLNQHNVSQFDDTSYSASFMCSQTFVDVLHQAGAQAKLLLYEGKTHTDIFVQVTNVDFDNE
jgi:hypothetical protein